MTIGEANQFLLFQLYRLYEAGEAHKYCRLDYGASYRLEKN